MEETMAQFAMLSTFLVLASISHASGAATATTCTYTSVDQCSDAALQPVVNTMAESYGPDSRCVQTGFWVRTASDGTRTFSNPLGGTGCYEYSCSSVSGVTIGVLGTGFSCSKTGEVLDVDITESGVRYQGQLICPSCLEICFDEISNCPENKSVELNFEKLMYSVIESVDSEDLALYVCLTADSVDRPFSVTLSPLSGTATANEDFTDGCKDIEFAAGVNVVGCGCVGIVSDGVPEPPEMFEIRATVSDNSIQITGQTSTIVQINDSII